MNRIKVLGQVATAATTDTDLYTVPALTSTTISTLTVANRTGGALTYRIAVRTNGDTIADKHYVVYDKTVAANDTDKWTIGMTLTATDVVTVYASATGLSFNLFGVETFQQ